MILDRYILKLWLPSFLGFFLIITGILLFGRVLRVIQAFGDNPIDAGLLFEMLFAIIPYFLTLTIPFSFFFAMLKVFSYLQQNSETDALLAAGVSPFRLLRPLAVLAFGFWIFLTWTAMEWMPAGQMQFLKVYHSVRATSATPSFVSKQFTEGFDGLTIYHAGEDNKGYMHQFMLEDKRTKQPTIYLAEKAIIQRNDNFLVLSMFNGTQFEGEGSSLRVTYFSTFSLSIDTQGLGEVSVHQRASIRPTWLNMKQLEEAMNETQKPSLIAEWHRRWLLPTTIFLLLLFAFPLAKSGKRSGKSKGWLWGVVLLLVIYNVQIVLHKQVSIGQAHLWTMWAGQTGLLCVGLILLLRSAGYFKLKKKV